MTMDIYQRTIRADSSPPPPITVDGMFFRNRAPSSPSSPAMATAIVAASTPKKCGSTNKPVKRSFDVAFLMAPDDLSKKRQKERSTIAVTDGTAKKATTYRDSQLSVSFHELTAPSDVRQSTGDYNLAAASTGVHYQLNPLSLTVHQEDKLEEPLGDVVRSAFTKVNHHHHHQHGVEAICTSPPVAISPSSASSTPSNCSGLSPDLSTYPDSLSPQPFVLAAPQRFPSAHAIKHYTAGQQLPYFVAATSTTAAAVKDEPDLIKRSGRYVQPSASSPPSHSKGHADNVPLPYPGFPMGSFPFPSSATLAAAAAATVPMFPAAAAAANLTAALLPSSMAAFSLPAQNVCAKCNMHFRMTSDLVYHMRSHHKNENTIVDPYKRRRDQDKLKCPVCSESFRERHHLTRHMTAHQDKEEDEETSKELAVVTAGLDVAPPQITTKTSVANSTAK